MDAPHYQPPGATSAGPIQRGPGVMLVLVPQGRGNWAPITVAIEGRHAIPLAFRVGDLFILADRVFRISKVLP